GRAGRWAARDRVCRDERRAGCHAAALLQLGDERAGGDGPQDPGHAGAVGGTAREQASAWALGGQSLCREDPEGKSNGRREAAARAGYFFQAWDAEFFRRAAVRASRKQ